MTDSPAGDAARELVKALEELTKLTGVRIDLAALKPKPKKPDLKVVK